ncbi:multidrug efflux pump transcriptional activator SxtR [Acinetobacter baumannii]|uniref:multidrug efflux pump transcriptional activator SxtR n=1 Tax=Acinetobacter baumannii TaxID=470 RepID=UPI003F516F1F
MELRHIRYFLAVAEEKNFTKAAQRLNMSQPPLSMQIRDLEEELGADLFIRSPHGVELTEAGLAFLNAIQPVQQRVEDAANLVKQVANGEVGQLRLGFTGTSMLNPLIPKCVRYFQQQYPKVNLKLEEANTLLLIDLLLEDRLDVAIIRSPRNMPDSLILQELLAEPLIAALPSESFQLDYASHEIDLTALRELDFIVSPPSVSAGLFDAIKQACHERGFEPKIGQNAPQIVSILSLVSANLGVSLVPESTKQLQIQGVAYRSLKAPVPTVGLGLAYKKHAPSQMAINFASVVQVACHHANEINEIG